MHTVFVQTTTMCSNSITLWSEHSDEYNGFDYEIALCKYSVSIQNADSEYAL